MVNILNIIREDNLLIYMLLLIYIILIIRMCESLKLVPESSEDLPTNFRSPLLQNFIKTLQPVLINTDQSGTN